MQSVPIITNVVSSNRTQARRGPRGRDRMVVEFTTTYEISAYHHKRCECESIQARRTLYNIM